MMTKVTGRRAKRTTTVQGECMTQEVAVCVCYEPSKELCLAAQILHMEGGIYVCVCVCSLFIFLVTFVVPTFFYSFHCLYSYVSVSLLSL